MDPFWGPSDANIRFCELKYAYFATIAEVHNVWSSLAYLVAGCLAIHQSSSLLGRASAASLCAVGVSSMALHATLRLWGELLDEGSMLVFVVLSEFMFFRQLKRGNLGLRLQAALVVANPLVFIWYIHANSFPLFLHFFTVQLVLLIIMSTLCFVKGSIYRGHVYDIAAKHKQLSMYKRIIVGISVARVFWELEQQLSNSIALFDWRGGADPVLCEAFPGLGYFHVLWHLISAYSAYNLILFADNLQE